MLEPKDKRQRHGAPVRRADVGDIQAVEMELYSALLPTNPKVGVEIMAKVGNSYKKRLKVSNRVAMFPKLLEEIEKSRAEMAKRKRWDKSTKEWQDHVCEASKKNILEALKISGGSGAKRF